jgi:hypothetical protein
MIFNMVLCGLLLQETYWRHFNLIDEAIFFVGSTYKYRHEDVQRAVVGLSINIWETSVAIGGPLV